MTMIEAHVLNQGGKGVHSLAEGLEFDLESLWWEIGEG